MSSSYFRHYLLFRNDDPDQQNVLNMKEMLNRRRRRWSDMIRMMNYPRTLDFDINAEENDRHCQNLDFLTIFSQRDVAEENDDVL